ncbi:MAG: FAD-binding protein [Helicobacteraceae bacterium]|nr:FAD-binding protein [Helicobacteraceae bacterium]
MVDVLVIGSGGAGMVAALAAQEAGASVAVVSKTYPTRSQTCMAQGGINASIGEGDSVESHIADTLKSAQGLGDEAAIDKLCREGVEAVVWLDSIGVPFSRSAESKIAQRRLGGASTDRACYAQDYTGLKILHSLYDSCLKAEIEFHNEHFLMELIIDDRGDDRRVCGAVFKELKSGELKSFYAKTVIMATGGYSRVYDHYSTNATGSTGDGLAAALRAGAVVSDLEFVQFHPTGLKNASILISESARGAGGHLLNAHGDRFTDELQPRDALSRAIDEEIKKSGAVFLDIRHLGENFIDHELPQERKLAKLYENVDPVTDLIPIKPVAHYTMGGIAVDERAESTLDGLFAVGECANHNVHGANRLGGNSLLELIVFGKEAGSSAAKAAKEYAEVQVSEKTEAEVEQLLAAIKSYTNEVDFYQKRTELGALFYRNAGIKRSEKGLLTALEQVHGMQHQLPKMGALDGSKVYNTNLMEFVEFTNMLTLAEAMLAAMLERKESRGAHARVDFSERDDVLYNRHSAVLLHNRRVEIGFTQVRAKVQEV